MWFLEKNNESGFYSGEAVDSYLQIACFYSVLGYPFTKCPNNDSARRLLSPDKVVLHSVLLHQHILSH
jgi:hypothetical protein